mgnify:FL=1
MSKLYEEHLEYLNESLEEIDYGTILITVYDGQITQIDATEKKRFTNTKNFTQKTRLKKSAQYAD